MPNGVFLKTWFWRRKPSSLSSGVLLDLTHSITTREQSSLLMRSSLHLPQNERASASLQTVSKPFPLALDAGNHKGQFKLWFSRRKPPGNFRSAARRPVGSWEEPFWIREDCSALEDPDQWITVIANLGWLRKITLFGVRSHFQAGGPSRGTPFVSFLKEEDQRGRRGLKCGLGVLNLGLAPPSGTL